MKKKSQATQASKTAKKLDKGKKKKSLEELLDSYLSEHDSVSGCFDLNPKHYPRKQIVLDFMNSKEFRDNCNLLFKKNGIEIKGTDIAAYFKSLRFQSCLKIAVATMTYSITDGCADDHYSEVKIESARALRKNLGRAKGGNHLWYRGQSDSSWGLSPTLLRGLEKDIWKKGLYVDEITVRNIYVASQLLPRAQELGLSEDQIDYSFMALMQHACSYSLFIDFTEDIDVAATFLCDRRNLNTFLFKNGSIFEVKIDEKNIEKNSNSDSLKDILENNPILLLNEKIRLGLKMELKRYNGTENSQSNELFANFETFVEAKKTLTPEVLAFESRTNDRMKVQKGRFLFFYGYACYQGNVFFQLIPSLKIRKFVISYKAKKTILKKLPSRNTQGLYSITGLMDPYSVLNK